MGLLVELWRNNNNKMADSAMPYALIKQLLRRLSVYHTSVVKLCFGYTFQTLITSLTNSYTNLTKYHKQSKWYLFGEWKPLI